MTTLDHSARRPAIPPRWICALLGIVMIGAGILALGDTILATLISVTLIGLMAIAAGVFEIIHAFWTKGWGGFLWQIVLGLLYATFGFMLVNQPVSGAFALTFALGAILFASGIVRCVVSVAHWRESGWMMLLSGIFGVLAGLFILFGNLTNPFWIIGFIIGIDLISHGVAWLLYALGGAARTA